MGRRATDNPLPVPELAERYLEGWSLRDLCEVYRASYRLVRTALTAAGIPIRSPHATLARLHANQPDQWRPDRRRRILTDAQVKRLREQIGYDPSWVARPEYEYDLEYDDA